QNMLEGILKTAGINYQGLDGQQLLKALLVGVDGIKDPTYASQTLGQMVVEMPGGIFVLLAYSLLIVLPFYVVVVLKQMVLIAMAILVPFWIAQTAFTGKYETMIGFANVFIRTLIVSFVCAGYWAIFVQQQTKWNKGEGFFASLNPVSLNGANVLKGISKFGLKGSEVMSNMGKRFGSEEMQKKASGLEEASKNLESHAERLKNQRSVTAASMTSR
ncbi:hypothetical protein, partial [Mycobacterium tuberculosis]|uniref:hypothetical protein n=1 Tax=Mycobacterium tuberculosis TaxID=1773 RepID=UPI00158708A2